MKVLIVDDNESLTALMKDVLETEESCDVETAGNGKDGYMAYLLFEPDVVVTDIEMPIKNGLEMVRDIRAHHPGIKAIYMSGNLTRYQTSLETEKDNYQANILNKPFNFEKMIDLFKKTA